MEEASILKALGEPEGWRFLIRRRSATPVKPLEVAVFQCPSDPEPSMLERGQVAKRQAREVLYDAIHPPDCMAPLRINSMPGARSQHAGAWLAGTAYFGSVESYYDGASLKRITDGMSQTILIAERAGGPHFYDEDKAPVPFGYNHAWIFVDQGWMTIPSSRPAINRNNWFGVFSFHDGAHVAMCGGSIRFLSEGIEPKVLAGLFSRNDGMEFSVR